MRISSFTIFNQLTRSLNENLRTMTGLGTMLSSGKKINNPSDDISGMMKSMDYRVSINEIEQHRKNIADADTRLSTAETTMASVGNVLIRAREIALQGSSSTQSAPSREALAEEVGGLRDQMLSLANTKFRSRYIFAGYKTDTEAFGSGPGFAYQGDSGEVSLITDQNTVVKVNIPGDQVFSSNGKTFMETLDTLYNDLLNNNESGIQSSLTDLDSALDHAADIRADLGSRLKRLDDLKSSLEDRDLMLKTYLSEAVDADLASTVSEITKTEVALQSLRQSGAQVLSQSLLNFIG